METLAAGVCCGFLGIWFVASALCQVDSALNTGLRKFDKLGMIPTWTFFAPKPGTSDYHLVYRSSTAADPAPTDWSEIPVVSSRRWFHCVWNPERRRCKVISDCINGLVRHLARCRRSGLTAHDASRSMQLSIPYLVLMQLVTQDQDSGSSAIRRQFAVVEKSGHPDRPVRVIMCSPFHRLTERTDGVAARTTES